MAATLGAMRGFLHLITDTWAHRSGSPRPFITILDVLEPRVLKAETAVE